MSVSGRPQMAHIMNMMRFPGAPVIAYLMADLPSGLLISILTTALFTAVQSHFLRIPSVRRYFGILPPAIELGPDGKPLRQGLPSFKATYSWATEGLRERWSQAAIEAQEKEKKRIESLNRRRGVGNGGIRRK